MNENSNVQGKIADDHPMKIAWDKYKASPQYINSFRWAAHKEHRSGSLWAAFCEGWYRREVNKASHKPTIHELEDILAEDSDDTVVVNPDGSVSTVEDKQVQDDE